MTRDEIISMAREAGLSVPDSLETIAGDKLSLERFAALVAAAEREACSKACDMIAADYSVFCCAPYEHMEEGARSCAAAIRSDVFQAPFKLFSKCILYYYRY